MAELTRQHAQQVRAGTGASAPTVGDPGLGRRARWSISGDKVSPLRPGLAS